MMRCTSSLTVEKYDDDSTAITTGSDSLKPALNKRRHSSFHPRRRQSDKLEADEGILIRVCLPSVNDLSEEQD
jgi:adiponectin receptor